MQHLQRPDSFASFSQVTPRGPGTWAAIVGYLCGGIMLGLGVVLLVVLTREKSASAGQSPVLATAVTDNVVRVPAASLPRECAKAASHDRGVRIEVTFSVDTEGSVREARAASADPALARCLEGHV